MPKRILSQSSIRSQMRQAQRKAEREITTAVRKAERDWERGTKQAVQKLERDLNSEIQKQARRVSSKPIVLREAELQVLVPAKEAVLRQSPEPRRDVFLCHAWPDRQHSAKQLFDALRAVDLDVWFSEEDVSLGTGLMRQLDKAIGTSKLGIVWVTPALLMSLRTGGIADQELGALLQTERVVPILHEVSFEELKNESPLLASRAGLSTADDTLGEIASKVASAIVD